MIIISDHRKDGRNLTDCTGGYEWWYFDGLSEDGKYGFVVIFYNGNPFSTRFNGLLQKGIEAKNSQFPAISISVYEDQKPIYYGFTEYDVSDCVFNTECPSLSVGPHHLEGGPSGETLSYRLNLEETLPSGTSLKAAIRFESPVPGKSLFPHIENDTGGHHWNLVQPRAKVSAKLLIRQGKKIFKDIRFKGKGYHDHNSGREPMHHEFVDWYWGRFHFTSGTLVYYVMNCRDEERHRAWFWNSRNEVESFDEISLSDKDLSLFGLNPARILRLKSQRAEVLIQQSRIWDNGPFYQRYRSDALLNIPGAGITERKTGITEFLQPQRIQRRLFWPLLNMRIRFAGQKPHWVQRSKRLYRWTWQG